MLCTTRSRFSIPLIDNKATRPNLLAMNTPTLPGTSPDRREFLKMSGLLAAGLALLPSWSLAQPARLGQAAPGLATLFWQAKAAELARGSTFLPASLRYCLATDIRQVLPGNAYLMGGTMPFAPPALLDPLLAQVETWRAGTQDQAAATRLALLAGALVHAGIDQALAPALPVSWDATERAEAQVYQAATLLRHYLTKGQPLGAEDAAALHGLWMEMVPRTLIRFHTIMPDEAAGAAWVPRMADWRARFFQHSQALAQAVAQPQGGKQRRYVEETRFFAGQDAILQRVSAFERVALIDQAEADSLLALPAGTSHSARALATGYGFLITLGAVIAGTAKPRALADLVRG